MIGLNVFIKEFLSKVCEIDQFEKIGNVAELFLDLAKEGYIFRNLSYKINGTALHFSLKTTKKKQYSGPFKVI